MSEIHNIKLPNLTATQIYNIVEEHKDGVGCKSLGRKYGTSRYFARQIVKYFSDKTVEEIQNTMDQINSRVHTVVNGIVNGKEQYRRYYDRYHNYDKGRCAALKYMRRQRV